MSDLIRRQDAIDAIVKYLEQSNVMDADVVAAELWWKLRELPSCGDCGAYMKGNEDGGEQNE